MMISKVVLSLSVFALVGAVLETEQTVYWNDSRVLVNRPSAALWSTDWAGYNASTAPGGCGTTAYPDMCGGAGYLCSYYDSATLVFNGTSITANFLSRWNGVVNATVYLDGELWTQVNTSNSKAEPFPQDWVPYPMTHCIPTSSPTKTGLSADVEHNVTVMVPPSNPTFGFVLLFQSFQYSTLDESTTPTSGVASSEAVPTNSSGVNTKAIVGGIIAGVAVLLAGAAAFFLRRKQQAQWRAQQSTAPVHVIGTLPNSSEETLAEKTAGLGHKVVGAKVV